MDTKHSIGDRLKVRIERIVPRGFGIAFSDGLTIFVALTVAGDLVDIRLTEIKGKTAFAEVETVIEPSPDRIDPPCQYFGACGGCDFQQMNYAAQLAAKVAMVRDCLHRIAKTEWTDQIPIIPSPLELSYRLRAQWHVETTSKKIGYYRRDSRDLVDIEKCIVLAPELNGELDALRRELPWETFYSDKLQVDAALGSDGRVSIHSGELAEPANEIEIQAAGESFKLSAKSFFQGNRAMVDTLVETAIGDAAGRRALDLYCGVGLFTLPLARRFEHVIGVEESYDSIEFAKRNATNANIGNAEFRTESVRRFLSNVVESDLDFVLLDPPRAGTEKDTVMNLIRLKPKRVSYVACEPSVLARDLKRFVENGYSIDSIAALDLFPQTHHVETVVHLKMT